jgi:two-component system sensor histidine kinase UhpB
MVDHFAFIGRWQQRFRCLSIFKRIAIGNSLVIVVGAIGGTLLTRHLTDKAADLWLILLFATIGILLSVFLNGWLISSALRPLRELRQMVDRFQAGQSEEFSFTRTETDPDICKLSSALDSLVGQLEKRNRQLRALSEQVINAQEEERRRIALSLHDDTGQALSMLIINLERLEDRLPAEDIETKKKLATSRELAVRTLGELRKIVRNLRPTILDNLGLIPAIRWYARSSLEEAGIRVVIDAPEETCPLPHQLTSTLFRVAQEAINNIVRHSRANLVSITFCQDLDHLVLKIEDDGIGFDVDQVSLQALSLQQWGLAGIQERANLIGGEIDIVSNPGSGTRIQVRVPFTTNGD